MGLLGEESEGRPGLRLHGCLTTKPSDLSHEQAATIPYAAVMALGLLRKVGVRPGQRVLVVGASGGIGAALLQLAKNHFGAEVAGVGGAAAPSSAAAAS